jgi:hypothetical protein
VSGWAAHIEAARAVSREETAARARRSAAAGLAGVRRPGWHRRRLGDATAAARAALPAWLPAETPVLAVPRGCCQPGCVAEATGRDAHSGRWFCGRHRRGRRA